MSGLIHNLCANFHNTVRGYKNIGLTKLQTYNAMQPKFNKWPELEQVVGIVFDSLDGVGHMTIADRHPVYCKIHYTILGLLTGRYYNSEVICLKIKEIKKRETEEVRFKTEEEEAAQTVGENIEVEVEVDLTGTVGGGVETEYEPIA